MERDEFGDPGLEQRSLACTGQQLIPDPLQIHLALGVLDASEST